MEEGEDWVLVDSLDAGCSGSTVVAGW